MKDEFIPPIKDRTTDDLVQIVAEPEKWNSEAIRLANNELINRAVDPIKIETAKYLSKKRDKIELERKANESYHICDFICENTSPINPIIEILFSWELKKDGYHRKAKQQKFVRIAIILILVILIYIEFL